MEFFKKETKIDFMGIRKGTAFVTVLLWALSLGFLIFKGINFGLDFTGGNQIEVRFKENVSPDELKAKLEKNGFHNVRVKRYGSTQDLLIRVANVEEPDSSATSIATATEKASDSIATTSERTSEKTSEKLSEKENSKNAGATPLALGRGASTEPSISSEQKIGIRIKEALQKEYPEVEIRRTEFVGSEVGEQLFEQGGIAVLVSILATMLYIALRFEYRLALSAAVGLCHDGVIVLGIFALFGFEFDLATLAAVLAVLGYSLNDTIVVFDRVRENFRKVRKSNPVEIMNLSINQTLSRTLMTSWLTLLVVLALLFFGGETLFGFSMAFFIGILVGTFSSIYVSGALALWLGLSRTDLLPKAKNEIEDRP